MVTIRELLSFAGLRELHLLTPPQVGIDNTVRAVTVDETPEGTRWLSGGELVLSSGFAVRMGALDPIQWLESLAQRQVAGLGLAHRFLAELPIAKMVTWAAAHELPILAVPTHKAWAAVMKPIYACLYEKEQQAGAGQVESLRQEVLAELIYGRYQYLDQVLEKGRCLGLDLMPFNTVCLLQVRGDVSVDLNSLRQRVRDWLKLTGETGAVLCAENLLVVILALKPGQAAPNQLASPHRLLHDLGPPPPGTDYLLGLGRTTSGPEQLHASLTQARQALELGPAAGVSPVVHYDELGVVRLLGGMGMDELRHFCRDTLGRLLEADDENLDLLRTLSAFFAEHMNHAACARRLFLHPHTVRYRIQKIELLTGRCLEKADDCLTLQIALKGWEIASRMARSRPG